MKTTDMNSVYVLTSEYPNQGPPIPVLVSDQRDAIDNFLEQYRQDKIDSGTVWVTKQYELSYRTGDDFLGNTVHTLIARGFTYDGIPVSLEVRTFCVNIVDFEAYQGE